MSLSTLGAGTYFGPGFIPDLHAWYDMSQESYNDLDAVTSISDRSGVFATALAQATGTAKPTFRTGANGIGGRSALSFDGGDFLTCARLFALTSLTAFTVMKTPASVVANQGYLAGPNFANTNEVDFAFGASIFKTYAGSAVNTSLAIAGSTNYVVTNTLNGASSVVRANGTQSTAFNPGAQNIGAYRIGSGNNTGSYGFLASGALISEVITFSRVLTTLEITLMELYLRRKYSI